MYEWIILQYTSFGNQIQTILGSKVQIAIYTHNTKQFKNNIKLLHAINKNILWLIRFRFFFFR